MKLRLHIIYIVAILLSACSTQLVIKSKQNSIVSVSASPDSLITSIIEPYKIGIDSVMNEVLCVSEIEMTKGRPESLLGNFVTDLCLDQYSYLADICIMNNGGLRSTLPQGEITRGKIYELMPFENELVILELNTLELFDLIEYIFVREGEPFSGLSVYSIDSCMVLSSRDILYR
ncbi:MAG: 5'-nucleotidase C-terminal domain-containing protein, partial [Flavobacteriales bacterium]|nr:5'-nucleotidase C-terminal domain-containing protein [Flavobacteriales bacterium]